MSLVHASGPSSFFGDIASPFYNENEKKDEVKKESENKEIGHTSFFGKVASPFYNENEKEEDVKNDNVKKDSVIANKVSKSFAEISVVFTGPEVQFIKVIKNELLGAAVRNENCFIEPTEERKKLFDERIKRKYIPDTFKPKDLNIDEILSSIWKKSKFNLDLKSKVIDLEQDKALGAKDEAAIKEGQPGRTFSPEQANDLWRASFQRPVDLESKRVKNQKKLEFSKAELQFIEFIKDRLKMPNSDEFCFLEPTEGQQKGFDLRISQRCRNQKFKAEELKLTTIIPALWEKSRTKVDDVLRKYAIASFSDTEEIATKKAEKLKDEYAKMGRHGHVFTKRQVILLRNASSHHSKL